MVNFDCAVETNLRKAQSEAVSEGLKSRRLKLCGFHSLPYHFKKSEIKLDQLFSNVVFSIQKVSLQMS